MSSPQVDRLQALLSRVQVNRGKPRASASSNVSMSNGPSASAAARIAQHAQPSHSFADVSAPFVAPVIQDSIDTTPPPAAFPKPQAQPMRPSAEPMRTRPAIEAEHVRVPDLKPMRSPTQPERPMPAPARPTAPGATPLEMALEGEVARAAESAAASMPVRTDPTPSQQAAAARLEETGGRVLADPTPPQPSRPIVQAVTKHPPVQAGSFAELLKRSLALRPR